MCRLAEALAMKIEHASLDDAKEILPLQKLAYQSEAKIYDDFQIPPLLETLERLQAKFKTHIFLKATVDGKIIGSVRVLQQDATCHIGTLMVHPDYQNQGVATKLLLEVEHMFPSCGRFELFTGGKSIRNIHLYKKLGYRVFKADHPEGNVDLVFFEKMR